MAKIVNGLNVDALMSTVEAIKGKPEIAKFKFRVGNKWISGTNSRATVKGFYGALEEHPDRKCQTEYEFDEPPVLLGEDKGPNPVEYLLVALSGCVTTALIAWASVHGHEIKSVRTELEGELDVRGFLGIDKSVDVGYQVIRITFHIESGLDDDTLKKIVQMAQDYSPVYNTVTKKVPVEVTYKRK